MALSSKDKYDLKKTVKELITYRGRHTELVSVYISAGYDINKVITQIEQEQGTATNIKSTSTRKNVVDALERMLQHLKLLKRTPENGVAVFSGNVAEREGQSNVKVWSIEPPVPLKVRIYRCDKTFVTEPLVDMLEIKEVYGLVVMDRRDASLALLKGKTIIPLQKTHSEVPGKTRAGGQCLHPNTMIQISDGEIIKISESHNPLKVKSVKSNEVKDSKITSRWEVKKDKIYKIITKYPRIEIESSKDHVFYTYDNGIKEKCAEELNEESILLMPEKIDVTGTEFAFEINEYYNSFKIKESGRKILRQTRLMKKLHQKQIAKKIGVTQTAISTIELGKRTVKIKLLKNLCSTLGLDFKDFSLKHSNPETNLKIPVKLDGELSQFLGYFMGDGGFEKERITLFEQNKDVAKIYENLAKNVFNANINNKLRKSKNYYQIRIYGKPIVKFILKEFPEIKKAKNSRIPEKIMKSSDFILARFLKGLFDAEGYVAKDKSVAIGMNNKNIIQQIQMLLLRFGILSSFSEYDNKCNPYSDNYRYTIELHDTESLKKFKKNIGFSVIKQKKLDLLLNLRMNSYEKTKMRQILVSGKEIRKIIEKHGGNLQLFPSVSAFFNDNRKMSKVVFRRSIMAKIKNPKLLLELKKIHDNVLLPVQVKEIKIVKKDISMIDISVKNQNFIANCLLVHNSAARFARLREGAAIEHFKKISEYMKEQFLNLEGLKGIIIGGPGVTVNDFMNKEYLTGDLKKKILGVKDLSYTGEFGLQELLDKSSDILAAEEVMAEKKILNIFLEHLAKKPGMVSYGEKEVMEKIKLGSVDVLLISEGLDDSVIDLFEEEAEKMGTEIRIISTETREGVQLRDMGGIAAILRYESSY